MAPVARLSPRAPSQGNRVLCSWPRPSDQPAYWGYTQYSTNIKGWQQVYEADGDLNRPGRYPLPLPPGPPNWNQAWHRLRSISAQFSKWSISKPQLWNLSAINSVVCKVQRCHQFRKLNVVYAVRRRCSAANNACQGILIFTAVRWLQDPESAVMCSAVQCSAVQCSAVQCRALAPGPNKF
jgi:hypothetical protein